MVQVYENVGNAYETPIIWARAPIRQCLESPGYGHYIFDDFINSNIVVDTSIDNWDFYGTNGDIDWLASQDTGILDVATSGADNDEVYLRGRPSFKFEFGSGKKVFLEARFASHVITDHGMVFGLGEEAFLVDAAIADDCATLITESFVGFRILTGDDDGLDIVSNNGAVVDVLLEDCTNSASLGTAAAAWTIDTYYKLGIRFDGDKTLEFFVNGIMVWSEEMTSTNLDISHSFGPVIGIKGGSAAVYSLYIDWIRYLAER